MQLMQLFAMTCFLTTPFQGSLTCGDDTNMIVDTDHWAVAGTVIKKSQQKHPVMPSSVPQQHPVTELLLKDRIRTNGIAAIRASVAATEKPHLCLPTYLVFGAVLTGITVPENPKEIPAWIFRKYKRPYNVSIDRTPFHFDDNQPNGLSNQIDLDGFTTYYRTTTSFGPWPVGTPAIGLTVIITDKAFIERVITDVVQNG